MDPTITHVYDLQRDVVYRRQKTCAKIEMCHKLIALTKVHLLGKTQCLTPTEEIKVPIVKDPFDNYHPTDLVKEQKNQQRLTEILLKKKICPISQIIDAL